MDRGADIHIKDDEVSINNTLTKNALLYIPFACYIWMPGIKLL
jgi:hypothetical protein